MIERNKAYENPYGIWDVSTEGDVEGRSVRHLGTHEGFVDEIALKLAKESYYSLNFSAVRENKQTKNMDKSGTCVSVTFGIDSGTWDMSPEERAKFFREVLRGRPVMVEKGQYYASVKIYDGDSPEAKARAEQEMKRRTALAKLTKEDLEALGIKP